MEIFGILRKKCIIFFVAVSVWKGVAAEAIVYVDGKNTEGPWNGRAWGTAFRCIQDGLDAAVVRREKEVWVAGGVYYPTETGERDMSFVLQRGVGLYGGFRGNEFFRSARNIKRYPTILSGDIGQPGHREDNSYHVLVGADAAILDGVIVEEGNANGLLYHAKGGAMINYKHDGQTPVGVSPILKYCVFRNNQATEGGALYNYDGANASLRQCVFEGNEAQYGGAMILRKRSSAHFKACIFKKNQARWEGGALLIEYGSEASFSDSFFMENKAQRMGGAVFINHMGSTFPTRPRFLRCNFSGNHAGAYGGAFYNYNGAMPMIVRCFFTGNMARKRGPVMANVQGAKPSIARAHFLGNMAGDGGEAVDTDATSQVLANYFKFTA